MLFAGTQNDGTYISSDGGIHWKKSSLGMEPNETVTSIVIDPEGLMLYTQAVKMVAFI